MDVHQTSSVVMDDNMPSALANEDQMVDNAMTVLSVELTNNTGTYLHDLNDDCLLNIFSRNPLTPMYLCDLAETCIRFKQIIQRMFSKEFVIKCEEWPRGEIIYTLSSKGHSEVTCNFQATERILKNFGSHLSELYMENDLSLVNLIARYCDDTTLKRLEIRGFGSIEPVRQQFSSIFRRLQQLRVYDCNLPIAPWDMNCDSLIDLDIELSTNGAALLRNTFPNLERLRFRFNRTSDKDDTEAFNEFFRRHGCLKSIAIYGESFDLCKLLDAISCSCNELEKLTLKYLDNGFFDISHLQGLTKLKALNIGFDGRLYDHPHCEEIDFSRAFKSLTTMQISFHDSTNHIVPSQFFDVLSQLQGLRELKLVHCYLSHVPWTRLKHLRKVYLQRDVLGLENFEQLANLLKFDWSCTIDSRKRLKLTKKKVSTLKRFTIPRRF